MTYLIPQELLQNQDTWKRTQLRMPHTLYNAIEHYATSNSMSLNTAIISLVDKGLAIEDPNPQHEFDIFMRHLKNLVTGMPVDETSTLLANMVNSWIENKKPTA